MPQVHDELDEGLAKRTRMVNAAPEMYALLKEIEFAPDMSYGSLCPICREDGSRCRRNNGHQSDCRLAAVLKAVEGE